MTKNKKNSAINYIIWLFIILIIILVIIGYFLIYSVEEQKIKSWFDYLNNQTVSILIGFIGIFVGYLLGYKQWAEKHKIELNDKYFAEYIGAIIKYLDLKQKEIDLRKAKNKRFWDFADILYDRKSFKGINRNILNIKGLFNDPNYLRNNLLLEEIDKERIATMGVIQAKIFLLRKLNNDNWENIKKNLDEFDKEYKEEYSKICVVNEDNPKDVTKIDVYRAEAKHIECHLGKTRDKIIKNIKSLEIKRRANFIGMKNRGGGKRKARAGGKRGGGEKGSARPSFRNQQSGFLRKCVQTSFSKYHLK